VNAKFKISISLCCTSQVQYQQVKDDSGTQNEGMEFKGLPLRKITTINQDLIDTADLVLEKFDIKSSETTPSTFFCTD
jgi:hypothetical protein